jgi:hypothetical protein
LWQCTRIYRDRLEGKERWWNFGYQLCLFAENKIEDERSRCGVYTRIGDMELWGTKLTQGKICMLLVMSLTAFPSVTLLLDN